MDHTAERNMRTIGEMTTTTLIHANLPKSAWDWATLHAINVINRTTDNPKQPKTPEIPSNFSRLEKWKGHALPGQAKGLYPFGCLAFKHVPGTIRGKLDAHATPCVYLGLDTNCHAYLLGTIFRLETSTAVEVTFVENVFPFRKMKHNEAPTALLWGADNNMLEGDPRLGMFDGGSESSMKEKQLDDAAVKAMRGGLLEPAEVSPVAARRSSRIAGKQAEQAACWRLPTPLQR